MSVTTRELIDLDRYPLHDLSTPKAKAVLEQARSDLRATGACQLEGFLLPGAIDVAIAEAIQLRPLAHRNTDDHNAYFEDVEAWMGDDDPHRIALQSSGYTIAWDLVPNTSPLREVYLWDPLLDFIGAALGRQPFYRNADPLGALNIVYYEEGDQLGWHFDRAEYAVTLMLQTGEVGGDFEYVPNVRTSENQNYDEISKILLGDQSKVISFPSMPGTLGLFQGRNSIHRVSPVSGERTRINAVLSYADEPGQRLNALTQDLFYGRTA